MFEILGALRKRDIKTHAMPPAEDASAPAGSAAPPPDAPPI
ncbi:hypothetical protein [Pusillimonas sp.]